MYEHQITKIKRCHGIPIRTKHLVLQVIIQNQKNQFNK